MKKSQKRQIIFISVVLFLWFFFAFFTPGLEKDKVRLQQQTVSSNLLEYGETGKILKKIDAISPIERRSLETPQQNINDVIKRAKKERKKWLRIEQYVKFKEKGVFCYIEASNKQENTLIAMFQRKDGAWLAEKGLFTDTKREVYPFFFNAKAEKIELRFFFANKLHPLDIRSIVFLKKGFHPIVFYDRISYQHFFRKASSSEYTITPNFFRIHPSSSGLRCKITLSFKAQGMNRFSKFQKKQGRNEVYLTANKNNPILKKITISDNQLKEISKKSIPVLSINTTDEALYSEKTGILKNPDQHGKDWERVAYIRYSRNGNILFKTFSGIRLQGGDPGRLKGLINFRLLFRKKYGKSALKSNVLFPGTKGLIKRLAVKQSEWPDWPLNSPIGYEITRQLGGLAPPTSPLLLYLNGKNLGLYYFVPHLGEKQVECMFPEKDLNYFRWRGTPHNADLSFVTNDFWIKLRSLENDGQLDEKSIREFFDIDNLIANVFAIIFSGTGDFAQGLILKEDSPTGKLFWYQWDMDHSFLNYPADITGEKTNVKRWQKSPHIVSIFNSQERTPRIHLLRTLIDNDQEFKKKLLRTMLRMLNHNLTDDFLHRIIDDYSKTLDAIRYPNRHIYLKRLKEFLKKRKAFLVKQIKELKILPEIKECIVSSEDILFSVNGFPQKRTYSGYHTVGESLSISLQNANDKKKILVNSEKITGTHFTFSVSEKKDCRIQINQY